MMLGDPWARRGPAAPVRKLETDDRSWRVLVESWQGGAGWQGRFVFEPTDARFAPRAGPAALAGGSQEDVVRGAHEVSEADLRTLLRSLG